MKRHAEIAGLSLVFAACLIRLAACGSASQQSTTSAPSSASTPRVLSDLASLSAVPSKAERRASGGVEGASVGKGQSGAVVQSEAPNLRRLFVEGPGSGRFAGSAAAPGDERLLNAKAEQFSQFSSALLHRVFIVAQQLEHGELARQHLPDNLKPAIITAIMDKDGRLKELTLEQHSGSGAIDKLMIEACKTGLWAGNPPPAALTADGSYHMRVEGHLKNFNTTDGVHWNFETHLGLALL